MKYRKAVQLIFEECARAGVQLNRQMRRRYSELYHGKYITGSNGGVTIDKLTVFGITRNNQHGKRK